MANWAWVYISNLRGPQGPAGPPGWAVGNLPASTDLFTFSGEGIYYVANPATMVNWPTQLAGVGGHVQFLNKSGVKAITIWSYGLVAGTWTAFTNSSGSNTFFPWKRTDHDRQGRMTPTGDNDALRLDRVDGEYEVRTQPDAAGIANLPVAVPGTLRSLTMPQVGLGVRFVWYFAQGAASGGIYFNHTNSAVGTHTWVGWQKTATKTDVDAVAATVQPIGLNQSVLQDDFTRRRGGKRGTAGKAVVALRFDDPINGLINSGIPPYLAARGVPASAVHCSGSFTAADLIALSNLGTWQTVKDWAHKQGMEVWHHGGNHQDASGSTALTREIVTSLATLQTTLPTLEVNKFAVPGVGGTNYDGFSFSDKPEYFFKYEAGKLIASGHSVSSGQTPGLLRQLDGKPRNGLTHLMVDAPAKLAAAYGYIDAAIEDSAGVCIMVHPNNLDKAGDYSTSAAFKTFIDHLVTLRDQGKIEILTMSGLLCADADSSRVANPIRNGKFDNGLTGWTGTGWAVTAGVASTSGTNALTQAHETLLYGWVRGGTMQLRARVRATAGAVVKLTQASLLDAANYSVESDPVTLPASTDYQWVRFNSCVPLTLSATDSVVTGIARVSGGTVDVDTVEYLPV